MQTYRTLIDVAGLQALQAAGNRCIVLDCGFDLADPGAGERAFADAHIAGARYAHLDRDLSGPKNGRNGRHPLPGRTELAATLGRWGVEPGLQVVVYDAQGGAYASRAWWLLRWAGHQAVALLDGGWAAWQAAGGATATGQERAPGGPPYALGAEAAAPTVDADTLLRELGRWTVLDARSGERFRGETEPLDPVAGRIPGARLRCFKDNLGADGRFLPAATLRAQFESLGVPAAQVVHQCGSGVTACHNLLAMAHAGLEGSHLYPGSWSEWCADPARPIARG